MACSCQSVGEMPKSVQKLIRAVSGPSPLRRVLEWIDEGDFEEMFSSDGDEKGKKTVSISIEIVAAPKKAPRVLEAVILPDADDADRPDELSDLIFSSGACSRVL